MHCETKKYPNKIIGALLCERSDKTDNLFLCIFLPSFSVTRWLDYFSIFWPFAMMKISPIMSQICHSRLSILRNKKYTIKNLPKWRNFAKSGHLAATFRCSRGKRNFLLPQSLADCITKLQQKSQKFRKLN